MVYGETPDATRRAVEALALRITAERAEHHEPLPDEAGLFAAE